MFLINYPKDQSEFEIQSKLYQDLLNRSIDVRGEVVFGASRFDLVIFNKSKIAICIVEVKKEFNIGFAAQNFKNLRSQISKYQMYNLPVLTCHGIKEIGKTITQIKRLLFDRKPTYNKSALKKMKLRDAMTKSIQYNNWLNSHSLVNNKQII